VLICFLKEYTQQIYIVPAMGSHGGANAENQKRILAHLGITEANMGVPIHSSMETVIITHTDDGIPVHMDANAQKADFTIPIGRITAHCGFHGNIESGLTKMCVIGLGKQHGADWCHEQGMENMSDNITKIGAAFLPSSNIPFCLGLMENGMNRICWIKAVSSEEILEKEPALLLKAKSYIPSIPFENIDLLVVDWFGKNIAGSGMDGNVIHRFATERYNTTTLTKRLVVLNLTKESNGNFSGWGLADISTKRVFSTISLKETYPNYLTSRCIAGGRIPFLMDHDYDAIRTGMKTASNINLANPRIVHIRSTKDLEVMEISPALLCEVHSNPKIISIDETAHPWEFDSQGMLLTRL
jgi:hypothetical protein